MPNLSDVFPSLKLFLNSIFKEYMSDPVTNYNYIEDAKVSVSIKTTNVNKCTLSEIFLSEILKRLSTFKSGYWA